MIGLERGTVKLYPHEQLWETQAQETISRLKDILGDTVKDIRHVGSTAIKSIKAKPIIDIMLAVDSFEDVLSYEKKLKEAGFYYRPKARGSFLGDQLLFACGSYYDGTGNIQTHFIHVVKSGSMDHRNYINFVEYMNDFSAAAKAYERVKERLADSTDDRGVYIQGKAEFITYALRKALNYSFFGKVVNIEIDRPIGYVHRKGEKVLHYPINYGYIPNVIGGDGEELDVYLLGVDKPVERYTVKIIAVIHRREHEEDKLVGAPLGMTFTEKEIAEAVHFQEKFYSDYIQTDKNDFFFEKKYLK